MNKKIIVLTLGIFGLLSVQSCTNLDEEVYDQVTPDEFGQNQEQLDALVGPIYSSLGDYFGNMNELNTTTDEQIVPTRGGDWKDGDRWKRLYQHEWNPTQDDGTFNGPWTWIYNNVTSINQQLINPSIKDARTIAELRALRAFYHYLALDLFGNVIIASGVSTESPDQKTRPETYAFVEKELLEVLPSLTSNTGGAQYGRMNKHVAHMILAKLYLNAEVYTGTPQYAKAVVECDSIINSGRFSLSNDFFANFNSTNQASPEIILATPLDKTKRGGFNIQMRTLHYKSQLTYNIGNAPWNGYCTLAEFYNSFEEKDVRKRMWIVGQQFDITGKPLDDDKVPMVFTPEIPAFEMPAGPTGRLAGARGGKYEIQKNNPNADQDNDFVIYRLADAYLMRGEAQFRLGNTAGALVDFNFIRTKRSVDPFAALTLDVILAERGREFAWEYQRRQDLIRFGKYTDARQFKAASPSFRNLFPIPTSQIALNPKLKQNPGY
ncbi:MAG: RagB/SusD family nutrient uptake outer membrane protein [Ferruginibacter sp.]|nr:RagB/SusD family nutrient uptake outer membrane protein [Cytophagales bacterium]